MRQNNNIRIARELVRIAKEIAASSYDNAQAFQKAISKPTPQNVGKFVKSITPKTGEDEDDIFEGAGDDIHI